MCSSTRSPHLFFGKLFYSRVMSRSFARVDTGRRDLKEERELQDLSSNESAFQTKGAAVVKDRPR